MRPMSRPFKVASTAVLVLLAASVAGAVEPKTKPARATDAASDARQNFVACVNGEAGRCDPSRLTDAERRLVENASSQRNYVACANGWSAGCDPLRLSPDQKRIVDATATQRAVAPCGSRWALGCGTSSEPSAASEAAGGGTQVTSGPPRYQLDTQRFYAPAYPEYEPRYAWSAGSWIWPTAIAAAATWPLWTHSYHYDYPWTWDWDWYGYPAWGWNGDHHHDGHHGHDGWDHGDGGHHGGKPPTYRPPPSPPPLHQPPTYRPTPIPKSAPIAPSRPAPSVKRDWR